MQIEKNIAATLQRRMDEAGKTKLEFSRDLGIPRSTLQGGICGAKKGLRSDSIEELAKRLGMSPAQLISGPGAAEAVSPAAKCGQLSGTAFAGAGACGGDRGGRAAALRRMGRTGRGGNRKRAGRRVSICALRGASARQECFMHTAFWASSGWMGEWKNGRDDRAVFSNDSAATAHLARRCTGQQLEPIHILDVIHDFMNTEARTL